MAAYPNDLKEYDPSGKTHFQQYVFPHAFLSGSWPILYDDFVEWYKEKTEKK